jgi:hypothetical protein
LLLKIKSDISLCTDQIPTELIQAGGDTLRLDIHRPINYDWNKEELSQQWKESVILFICKKGDKSDCSKLQRDIIVTNYIVYFNTLISRLSPYVTKLLRIITVDFDVIDQLLIRYSKFIRYWRKGESIMDSTSVIHRI